MKYIDLIHKIKQIAGAKPDESADALEIVVENIASHLTDYARKRFSARLPEELQTAAQTPPTAYIIDDDIVDQLMDIDDVDENQARENLKAAWQALAEQFDTESVEDIRAELPQHMRFVLQ